MSPNPNDENIDEVEEKIRQKRLLTLLGAYELMKAGFHEVDSSTVLNDQHVALTIEEYLRERRSLIACDKIPRRIQRHKIAGLMAAAICHNRPLQVVNSANPQGMSNSWDNEYMAIYHGLAICAEECPKEKILLLMQAPHFNSWFDDFVALLRWNTPRPASLIHIFQTLCLAYFPENLDH
jgi:hypothetical protein